MEDKIECKLCGAMVHSIQAHLGKVHPGVTPDDYIAQFPTAPMLSETAKDLIAKKRKERGEAVRSEEPAVPAVAGAAPAATPASTIRKALNEVFGLGRVKVAMSAKGEPIPITVLNDTGFEDMIPSINEDYIYEIDELKNAILAVELSIPCYIWGHKGSGKSEMIEQIAARTGRPYMRVQHTVNTEESHIVGQWTVKGGETVFEFGPLPLAMLNGWLYCADEYDFAMPNVTAVYQSVLEGKALVIKEAPAEQRIIKPHPNFRFFATGNTNGTGDETGLYQGTVLQNSANYDRFGVVLHKEYMRKAAESQILQAKIGLVKEDADKLVDFAALVREAYDGGKISDTISPRTLIYAATLGVKRGSFRQGIGLSFLNKLTRVDKEVVDGLAQRTFG